MNRLIKFTALWVIAILLPLTVRTIELKGASLVTLAPSPPLSGAISQSLVGTNSAIPVINQDFKIKNIKYLDNQNWAVVNVSEGNQDSNTAFVVLERVGGAYRVVLGPGTAFSISSTQSLPSDVAAYLKDVGVLIYTPLGDK